MFLLLLSSLTWLSVFLTHHFFVTAIFKSLLLKSQPSMTLNLVSEDFVFFLCSQVTLVVHGVWWNVSLHIRGSDLFSYVPFALKNSASLIDSIFSFDFLLPALIGTSEVSVESGNFSKGKCHVPASVVGVLSVTSWPCLWDIITVVSQPLRAPSFFHLDFGFTGLWAWVEWKWVGDRGALTLLPMQL